MDKKEIIQIAMDAIQHKVPNNYDANKTSESLRQAFIDANNGSTKIDIKTFRRHPELYDIVEEIVPSIIHEGLTGDEFFMQFVDYRNEALGDDTEFWTPDNSLFIVSDAAEGTQGIRRQRLGGATKVTIPKSLKTIKIYEELNRLLAGRVDFNEFVNRVAKSYLAHVYNCIYDTFNGITASTDGFSSTYFKTGVFSEETLVELISHVEAACGAPATIIGTKGALRKVVTATVSENAKNSMNALGHYGVFNGTNMISAKQAHRAGTDTFILDDTKLYIVASDDKFIKHVDSGEGLLIEGEPTGNGDLTREYLFGQSFGDSLIISGRMGVYDLT